jgi:peptidyl-prolyl cis-trans isomerase C
MKYLFLLLGAASAWGQQQTPPPAPPAADPVVITVGDMKITKSQFEQIIATFPAQQRANLQTGAGKKQLAEQLVDLETLAQEGHAQKVDQDPKIKADMKLQSDRVLAQHVFQEFLTSAKPDDADLRAYYAAHKQEWEQVKARHILIRMQGSQAPARPGQKDLTDAEALAKATELRTKILGGASFADLAKTESDDTGTAVNGGELGAFGKGRMVPQFEKAAFAQEIGKVGEPVKSPYGYHLILVEEHSTKSFDDVKVEIEQKIKPEMAQKGLENLKKKTTIVLDEAYFK